ncbi:hypothetical protein WJX82_003364 [Trebouxia sp. C0006]
MQKKLPSLQWSLRLLRLVISTSHDWMWVTPLLLSPWPAPHMTPPDAIFLWGTSLQASHSQPSRTDASRLTSTSIAALTQVDVNC